MGGHEMTTQLLQLVYAIVTRGGGGAENVAVARRLRPGCGWSIACICLLGLVVAGEARAQGTLQNPEDLKDITDVVLGDKVPLVGQLRAPVSNPPETGDNVDHWFRFEVSGNVFPLGLAVHRDEGSPDTDVCIYRNPVPSRLIRHCANDPRDGAVAWLNTSENSESPGGVLTIRLPGTYYLRIVDGCCSSNYPIAYRWSYGISRPGARISPTQLELEEEGSAGRYEIQVTGEPSGTVTVTPTSSDPNRVIVSGALQFNRNNWRTPQFVDVRALADADAQGEQVRISHTVTGYGDISADPVTINVRDDDTPGVQFSATAIDVVEGDSNTYTVALLSAPSGQATITLDGGGLLRVEPAALSFDSSNWPRPQTVTVTALDDDDAADAEGAIRHAVTGYGAVTDGGEVTVKIRDNDTPGVMVSATNIGVPEDGSGSYDVRLVTEPSGEVTVTPRSDNPDVTVSPAVLTFKPDNWSMAQTVSVAAARDDDSSDETATIRHAVAGYGDVKADAVTVRVSDTWRAGPEPDKKKAIEEALQTVAGAALSSVTSNVGARFSSARGGAAPGLAEAPAPVPGAPTALRTQRRADPTAGPPPIGAHPDTAPETYRGLSLGEAAYSGAFEVALGAADGEGGGPAQWTLWGNGDIIVFEKDSRASGFDGDLKAGYLGVDTWLDERWLAGVAAARTVVDADYSVGAGRGGTLDITLTGLYPYVRYAAGDGGEVWGILGGGRGDLENAYRFGGARANADLTMYMAAAGTRQALDAVGDIDLAVFTDAGFGRLKSKGGAQAALLAIGNLSVDAWRARVGAEASQRMALDGGATLTPFVEAAGRYDGGGDGEAGIEISGGAIWTDPASRIGISARGRVLALHSESDYREYGASVTVSVSPDTGGEGLSLALTPRIGADPRGADALWRDDPFALSRASTDEDALSVKAAAGYGFAAGALSAVLTPFGEFDLRGGGTRQTRAGLRYALTRSGAASFELAAARREYEGRETDHRLTLTGRVAF